jgi:predicted amidohydrolase
MQEAITLALWQCTPLPLDVAANLRRLSDAAETAAQRGADILVCPEMFVTGYAIGAAHVASLAVESGGEPRASSSYLHAVADVARAHKIAIIVGYPERDADSAIYNAAVWFDAGGHRVWNYRKTHLFGALDRDQFSAGVLDLNSSEEWPLPVFKGWCIGLLICYDVEFPENTRRLALAGADLIIVPTANMAEFDFVATTLVPVRAYENQCFVAYANYTGAEADWTYGGLSTVAAPDGSTAGQLQRLPDMLVVRLEAQTLRVARRKLTHVRDLQGDKNEF